MKRVLVLLLFTLPAFAQMRGEVLQIPSSCGYGCWATPDLITVTMLDTARLSRALTTLSAYSRVEVIAEIRDTVVVRVLEDGGRYFPEVGGFTCRVGDWVLFSESEWDRLCERACMQSAESLRVEMDEKRERDSVSAFIQQALREAKP